MVLDVFIYWQGTSWLWVAIKYISTVVEYLQLMSQVTVVKKLKETATPLYIMHKMKVSPNKATVKLPYNYVISSADTITGSIDTRSILRPCDRDPIRTSATNFIHETFSFR